MNTPMSAEWNELISSWMIELARATKSQRIIVAGGNSTGLLFALHRQGYARVTTTKSAWGARGQHDVALMTWHEPSSKALKATLAQLVPFLSATGVLVVWIGSRERLLNQTLRNTLGHLRFRIEAGAGCGTGIAVAARRLDSIPAAVAA